MSIVKVMRSVYPIEYNRNNPMEGFNQWAEYIHAEVRKMAYTVQPVIKHYNHELAKDLKVMARLTNEAKQIINNIK